jgi:prephenate dehydrogenase
MRLAVIGLGRMGRALADRLLEKGQEVSVWNRTPGRATALQAQGARVMRYLDDVGDQGDAVFLCLADDQSTLDVATSRGGARSAWAQTLVVNTGTVAPDVITALGHAYGERFVNAHIIAAPQQLRAHVCRTRVSANADGRRGLGRPGRRLVLDSVLLRLGGLRVDQRRLVGAVIGVDGGRRRPLYSVDDQHCRASRTGR